MRAGFRIGSTRMRELTIRMVDRGPRENAYNSSNHCGRRQPMDREITAPQPSASVGGCAIIFPSLKRPAFSAGFLLLRSKLVA
jgi:hypothetical protein